MTSPSQRKYRRTTTRALLLGGAMCALAGSPASADDRHSGYYYPEPASSETYVSRTQTLPDGNRRKRVLYITQLTNSMMDNPYPPQLAIFPKGERAEKLIITSLYDGAFGTVYRMRGLLALLTARSRTTEFFREFKVEEVFTFLDLLKLLGFEQLTVTDGDAFAHQILIK